MFRMKAKGLPAYAGTTEGPFRRKSLYAFFPGTTPPAMQPALLHFNSTPLFRLEKCREKYAHLLKKKDMEQIGPIVNYFINNSGHVAYLGGDVINNLYLRGKKRTYRTINILAIVTTGDLHKYSAIMNNIISSNDGAFSLGLKYWVRKNRKESCFSDIALARYIIEPRLEGPEKLLSLFKPASIELDFTTNERFQPQQE